MVKVQKPVPKTFGMKANIVNPSKKKQSNARKQQDNGGFAPATVIAAATTNTTPAVVVPQKVKSAPKAIQKAQMEIAKSSKELKVKIVPEGPATKKALAQEQGQVQPKASHSQKKQPSQPQTMAGSKVDKQKQQKKSRENSIKGGKVIKAQKKTAGKKEKLEKIVKNTIKNEDNKMPTAPAKSEPAPEDPKHSKKTKSATRAKQNSANSNNNKNNNNSKTKATIEPKPFNESQFRNIVSVDNIKRIVEALTKLVGKEAESKKNIFTEYRFILDVISFKIPNCPRRVYKLNLKHSIVDKDDDDVVIVVPDLKRGAKADYEPTIQHYEDMFNEAGIEGLKIMPFSQLRKECHTFEAVRKFSNTYDYFLCDGRILGHLTGFCGKIFQTARKTFHGVRMEKNIKAEIDKALHRTAFRHLKKGTVISIPVANHKQSAQLVAENIHFIVDQLKSIYAGGWENIRSMYLKVDIVGTSALPIFISLSDAPAEAPNVIGPREQRMHKLKKDANAVLSKFVISKDASIIQLNAEQIKRKRHLKETREKLIIDTSGNPDIEEPEDNDGDESIVPAKKARKEKDETAIEHEVKKKDVEESDGGSDDDSEGSVGEGDSDDNDNATDDDDDEDDDGNDDNDDDIDEEDEVDEDDDDAEGEDDDFDDDEGNKDDDDDDDDDDEEEEDV